MTSLPRLFCWTPDIGFAEIIRTIKTVMGIPYLMYETHTVPEEIREEVRAFLDGEIERPEWRGFKHPFSEHTFFKENLNITIGVVNGNGTFTCGDGEWAWTKPGAYFEYKVGKERPAKMGHMTYNLDDFIDKGIRS